MRKQLKQVLKFHQLFHSHIGTVPSKEIPNKVKQTRIRLIKEETKELIHAIESESVASIAKELADVIYVVLGTVISFGLQDKFVSIFDKVHQSNLSKLDRNGTFQLQKSGQKVQKGSSYEPPDIESIL